MIKRMFLMLAVVGLFFLGLFGWKAFEARQSSAAMAEQAMPPVTVSTTAARSETWAPSLPSIGTLRAGRGVNVTAQESGIITELRFESGQSVRAGDLLAQQYVADEIARLAGLEADLRLAELNLERAADLLGKKLISQFDYDVSQTDRDRAAAMVRNLRLTIDKKSIRAPFAGRIGIRRVDLGQHIEPGDEIVRLESLDQMLVDFRIPQRSIGRLRLGQPLAIRVDAYPGRVFRGEISALAPKVQQETRDVQVEGLVENAGGELLPGMFAEIDVDLPAVASVVTLPQSAVTYSPYGSSVFRVVDTGGDTPIVESVFVSTGETRGDQVAVLDGIAVGDVVVTAGQLKLRDGSRIIVDNSVVVSDVARPDAENN